MHRQSIVKVLGICGVDGEGSSMAHISASSKLIGSYTTIYTLRSTLNLLLEVVREVELCQDGVHLGIVISCLAEALNELTIRQTFALGPLRNTHNDLIAILNLGVTTTRKVYICSKATAVGGDKDCIRSNLSDTHIGLRATLQHLDNSTLKFAITRATSNNQRHPIAIQRTATIAAGYIYITLQSIDLHIQRPWGQGCHDTLVARHCRARQAVLATGNLLDKAVLNKLTNNGEGHRATIPIRTTRGSSQVLERKLIIGELPEHIDDERSTLIAVVSPLISLFSHFLLHYLFKMWSAIRSIIRSPTVIASSLGRKVAVCEPPDSAPTPKR